MPKDDEVLVKVIATSLNFDDKAFVKGEPFLVCLMGYGLFKPKHPIPDRPPQDPAFIGELLESQKIVPVIDREYLLREIPEAMQYLGSGQHHGKVVIKVQKE